MFCSLCDFCEHATTNKIEGIGNPNAEIMVVVPTPTRFSDRNGELYSGDTGNKLRYLIDKSGIDWDDCYVTSAIKCYAGKRNPNKEHKEKCSRHLDKEILTIKPKVIIAMGDVGLEMLTDLKTIADSRCQFHEYELEYLDKKKKLTKYNFPVVATFNPAACAAKWEYDDLVIRDLKMVKKFLKTGEKPKERKIKYEVADTLKKLKKFKKELISKKEFSFDFETTGLSFIQDDIILAVFSHTPGQSIVFPCHTYPNKFHKKYTEEEKEYACEISEFVTKHKKEIQKTLKEIFSCAAVKVAHNGKFDVKFAKYNRMPVKNFSFDTIIAHSLIDENKPHDLTFLNNWYKVGYGSYDQDIWEYVGKNKNKSFLHIPPSKLHAYAAMDSSTTLVLKKVFKKKLKEENLLTLFKKQQMPLVHLMSKIEYRGVKIDIDGLNEFSRTMQGKIAIVLKKLRKIVKNKEFNPGSPTQVREYLIAKNANLSESNRTPTGDLSTDADALKELATKKRFKKFANLMIEFRTMSKLKSTYLDGSDEDGGLLKRLDPNNYLHCTYNPHTPRTGRLSSSGPNLQNIPRYNPKLPTINIRKLFIPSQKNWIMGSADFRQLEMRIVAYLSRDYVMIEEIRNNVDIHSRNAVMFGKILGFLPEDMTEKKFIKYKNYEPPKDWEKIKDKKKRKKIKAKIQRAAEFTELRVNAKTLGFGLNYGKTAKKLAEEFGIDEEEVEKMIELYFEKYYKLATWREKQQQLVLDKGYLILPETRRKRRFTCKSWFDSKYSKDCWRRSIDIIEVGRQAMNFPIQGYANEIFTAGGNYKQGKLELARQLVKKKFKSKIILSLHDGIIMEGPPKEIKSMQKICEKVLNRTLGKGKKYEVKLEIDFDMYDKWDGKKIAA